MGQDATATLSEIEAARQRLERDVDVLEERVRPDDLAERAQKIGAAAAAGSLGLLVIGGVARHRLRQRSEEHHARVQAEALASALDETRASRRPRRPEDVSPEEATSTVALLAALAALAATILQVLGRRRSDR